ncbi:MAG: response regulator [Lachnospiraceae bacterium]|nr:response regulator [Lachnospiraceae bacterium]
MKVNNKKEIREILRAEKMKNKIERRSRFRWVWLNVLEHFRWDTLDKDQRIGRVFRDFYVLLSAALSITLYYYCFVVGQNNMILSMVLFSVYLIPFAFCTILYGFGSSIVSFSLILIGGLVIAPSNVYLLFLHLITLYAVWNLRANKRCVTAKSAILSSLVVGLILSAVYYVVFVMVSQAVFMIFDPRSALMHLAAVFPQAALICFLMYLYWNKMSEKALKRLGINAKDFSFRENIREFKKNQRAAGLSEKLFMVLLVEAIFLGIFAAAFANSLLPGMMQKGSAPDDVTQEIMEEGEDLSSETSLKNMVENINVFIGDIGFEDTYSAAKIDKSAEKFTFSSQAVAFDLKLIMMLLCIIHPIVYLANLLGRIIFTEPIEKMTGVMKGFDENPESRILVGKKLAGLGIHTGDEIEELYGALYETVGELNTYIDKIKEEQKLREDLRVAKAASEAKSSFLSNVSHEIRTPINAVLGMDEMILRESNEKHIKKYAMDIKNSGKTLLALINDLLDFSKIEAGKMEIIPVEYELSSVINDLINMVSSKASEKGLELKVDVDRNIPHVLFGDEIRVKQCILNILNNAVKYTQKGRVTMSFTYRELSADEIALRVRVEDTGIGIKQEDLSKLYSPFERIEESRNRTIEGTGLGMSIVKQLLDMMGSRLEVKSVYGEGSDFSFEIIQKVVSKEPIGDFNETYMKSLESMSEYRSKFIAPDGRILVVDDTPMNLTVVKGLLKETLLRIDTAQSGAEAIEKVKEAKYDIIFMDQRMPEMDGTETLQKMKQMGEENKSKDSPVIILTANVVSGARESFIKAGFDDYLSKPIDTNKMESMIAKYLPDEKLLSPDPETEEASGKEIPEKEETELEKFYKNSENLDYKAGIAGCMNEDILKEALHDFYVALKDGPDTIESLWKKGDLENYSIKVHALKSSSRIIGATALSEQAAFLEKCSDERDTGKIDELTPKLLELYRSYGEALSKMFDGDDDSSLPLIEKEELLGGYEAVKEAVSAFDFDTADAVIGMLKAYRIPGEEKERFELLCDRVTALDRDRILEIL